MIKTPKVGDKIVWKGKVRIVSRYAPATSYVWFVDHTSAKFSTAMQFVD